MPSTVLRLCCAFFLPKRAQAFYLSPEPLPKLLLVLVFSGSGIILVIEDKILLINIIYFHVICLRYFYYYLLIMCFWHIIGKEYLIFYYLVSRCVICHWSYEAYLNIFKINKIKNRVIFNNIFKHKI